MQKHTVLRLGIVAAASSLLLSSCGPMGDIGGLEVGQPAPKIEAAGWLNGDAPKESDLRGKVVVVEAWASW